MGAHCYRSSNLLHEHRFTGTHCYRSSDLQVHIVTGAQICYRSTDLQVHIVTRVQIYRCTLLQEFKSVTGAQIYRCTLLQELRFTGTHLKIETYKSKNRNIYRSTLLQELKSVTGAQIYRCTLKGITDLLLLNWKFLTAHFVTGAHIEIYGSTLYRSTIKKEEHNRPIIAQPLCECKMCLFLDLFLCSCNRFELL